ncbi:MAG: hypothetical protein WCD73_25890, partial [Pseudolabrys sp.]
STVSCTAGILPSAHGCKDRGLDLSVMVLALSFGAGSHGLMVCGLRYGRLSGSDTASLLK